MLISLLVFFNVLLQNKLKLNVTKNEINYSYIYFKSTIPPWSALFLPNRSKINHLKSTKSTTYSPSFSTRNLHEFFTARVWWLFVCRQLVAKRISEMAFSHCSQYNVVNWKTTISNRDCPKVSYDLRRCTPCDRWELRVHYTSKCTRSLGWRGKWVTFAPDFHFLPVSKSFRQSSPH